MIRTLLAVLFMLGLATPAHAAASHHRGGQACSSLIAHRGGSYPGLTENGMAAIAETHARGVHRFEVDVRTSADNTLWIMHDETIDRTSTGTGAVADLTGKQLRAVTLDDGGFIPNIGDILRYARDNGMTPMLHIKDMNAATWDLLRTRLNDFGMVYNVIIFVERPDLSTANTEVSRTTKMLAYNPLGGLSIPSTVVGVAVSEDRTSASIVASTRADGYDYWVGTPVTQDAWDKYNGWGANGMFIDNVAGYLATCS